MGIRGKTVEFQSTRGMEPRRPEVAAIDRMLRLQDLLPAGLAIWIAVAARRRQTAPEGFGYRGPELSRIERLGEKVDGSQLHRRDGGFGCAVGSHHRHGRLDVLGTQIREQIHAGLASEAQVEDEKIVQIALHFCPGLSDGRSGIHVVSVHLEREPEGKENVLVIVHEQQVKAVHGRYQLLPKCSGSLLPPKLNSSYRRRIFCCAASWRESSLIAFPYARRAALVIAADLGEDAPQVMHLGRLVVDLDRRVELVRRERELLQVNGALGLAQAVVETAGLDIGRAGAVAAEDLGHDLAQGNRLNRLFQKVNGAELHCAHGLADAAVGRDHECRRLDAALAHLGQHVEAAVLADAQIEHDEIITLRLKTHDRLVGRGGFLDLVPIGLQSEPEGQTNGAFVVDDENFGRVHVRRGEMGPLKWWPEGQRKIHCPGRREPRRRRSVHRARGRFPGRWPDPTRPRPSVHPADGKISRKSARARAAERPAPGR